MRGQIHHTALWVDGQGISLISDLQGQRFYLAQHSLNKRKSINSAMMEGGLYNLKIVIEDFNIYDFECGD